MAESSYQLNDLLVMIGQATVDLAYLRAQVAQLQQRLMELEPSPNGRIEAPAEATEAHA